MSTPVSRPAEERFRGKGAQRSAVAKFGELHDLRVFAKVRRSLDDATQTAQ
ncbi:MAG TPA: hypothetical protein VIT66_01070 [Lysobacter sp.]